MPDSSAKPTARAHARVGDRHDDVRIDRRLAREHAAEIGAGLVDALAEDVAVGPREVHVLEDAVRQLRYGEGPVRLHAVGADHQHLAGLDVAHVVGANQIERARLGADDPRVGELAERERTEAVRIPDGNQPVLREHHERERAADLRHGLDHGLLERWRPATCA